MFNRPIHRKSAHQILPALESLEHRWLMSSASHLDGAPAHAVRHQPHMRVANRAAQAQLLAALEGSMAHPDYNTTAALPSFNPDGYSPAQIRRAYGFDKIAFGEGAIQGDGAGQTIAIIDAFDDPTIAADLAQFDQTFNLPTPPSFRQVAEDGTSNLPVPDPGWATEIALDVEWSHALAPGANILLVEAQNNSYDNLLNAVDYARSQSGVSVVSMSWGGEEFGQESALDGNFTTPQNHQGITFIASTGDAGAPGGYPAFSPNVLAVGGTSLYLDSTGSYQGETGWSGSGGGLSQFEPEPWYQQSAQSSGVRAIPDVAFDADPQTGVPVCDSYSFGESSPWLTVGGTSFGAPAWAALIAVANQGRVHLGQGTFDGSSQLLPQLYSLSGSDFNDITSGFNGFEAGPGYDLVTGLGSPNVPLLIRDLLHLQPTMQISGSADAMVGQTYVLSLSAHEDFGTVQSWLINWGDGTLNQVNGDPSTITHTYSTVPGQFTITATASDEFGSYDASPLQLNVVPPPSPQISGAHSVVVGTQYTLNLAAQDPVGSIQSWTINWGDGTVDQISGNPNSATHTYNSAPAAFKITAAATDQYGSYTANSTVLNVVPPPVPTPDLAIGLTANWPQSVIAGRMAKASVTISNQGKALARGVSDLEIYAYRNSDPGAQPILLSTLRLRLRLVPGQSARYTANFLVPRQLSPGTYRIAAVVDASNVIADSNGSNNEVVSPQPLIVVSPGRRRTSGSH